MARCDDVPHAWALENQFWPLPQNNFIAPASIKTPNAQGVSFDSVGVYMPRGKRVAPTVRGTSFYFADNGTAPNPEGLKRKNKEK